MDAGVTSFRSILDKPLTQLTEEDISQLTREDCRKYLKEKGMRRPSWNKSQAIQQVISLKALLETSEDSGAGALRRILVSRPPGTQNSADSAKEPSAEENNEVLLSAEDTPLQNVSPKDTPPVPPSDSQQAETDAKARPPGTASGLDKQMTIFYCGKINVYDGVPPDKAQAILHLAASPIQLPLDGSISGTAALPFPYHLQSPSDKHGPIHPNAIFCQTTQTAKLTEFHQHFREKGNITHEPDVELQANRKESVQRYLEKKKDRVRFKSKKCSGPTSSTLEVYLNQHVRVPNTNGQLSGSSTSSPNKAGLSYNLSNSVDNHAKMTNLSVDLNEDVQER